MPDLTIVYPSGYREPLECASLVQTKDGWTATIAVDVVDDETQPS